MEENTLEIWRPVIGYEGLYEVSSYGRVRSLKKNKVIKFFLKGGYPYCGLFSDGKQKNHQIHRLVAQAFIPNPDNLPQVNHKDEDKTNNIVDNLEWCDRKYNMNYGSRTERFKQTMKEKGYFTGLTRKEYMKQYYLNNKEKFKK